MKDTHTLLHLPLLLLILAGPVVTTDGESEISYQAKDSSPKGPSEVTILGPDFVTVGVPSSVGCTALCSPPCSYTMSLEGQRGQGNELAFTVPHWVESLTVTCTAQNTYWPATVRKTLQVLAGPANISITAPDLMTPGAPHSFQCHADCRPSCKYTWGIGGHWFGGSGNTITVTPQKLSTSKTLTCKAINSVSGLYATATRTINVTSGPSEAHIVGPDSVAVGLKSKFLCAAKCTPSCHYSWTVDGHTVQGDEMEITVIRRVKSAMFVCEAQNRVSGTATVVTKTVRVEDHGRSIATDPRHRSMATQVKQALALILFAVTLPIVFLP